MGVRIVVIGGGSSYTPELMEGFIKRYDKLPISEIWLVDIEESKERLNIISSLSQRMWDANNYDVKVYATLNRREALKNADFVVTQFRVGLLNARIKDERIPLLHGYLGQETNGAGGMFKALRTIPVMKEIVNDIKELCPEAWLINFTNPSGIITEAIIKQFHFPKCVGLCNVPVISMMKEPEMLGMKTEELNFRFFGLNHFHWHKIYDLNNNDLTSNFISHLNDENNGTPKNIPQIGFNLEMIHSLNLMPCGYHRYYYAKKEMLEHAIDDFKKNATRAEQVKETERKLFELYKDKNLKAKPELLSKRGGAYYSDAACECISSIYNDSNRIMVVSTQNNGAIPCLKDDSIVEVSCYINKNGAVPIPYVNEIPASCIGLLTLMKSMEENTINAAITGDVGKLLEAFSINPLIESGSEAVKVMNELMVAHKKYLPQFADYIKSIENTVEITDPNVIAILKSENK